MVIRRLSLLPLLVTLACSGCTIRLGTLEKSATHYPVRDYSSNERLATLECLRQSAAEVSSSIASTRNLQRRLMSAVGAVSAIVATYNAFRGGDENVTGATAGLSATLGVIQFVQSLLDDKYGAIVRDFGTVDTYLRQGPVGAGSDPTPSVVVNAAQSLQTTLDAYFGNEYTTRVLDRCVAHMMERAR